MVPSQRIKVFICHVDPLRQAGSLATLGVVPDLEVAAAQASELLAAAEPASYVAVTDYESGVQLAERGIDGRRHHRGKVVIVTTNDREWDIRAALACGVRGYLLTGCGVEELASTVRAVHRGERILGPRVAAKLAETVTAEPLTAREEQVLRLVIEGLCNKSIANELGIAVGTVKSHLKSTFGKLQVTSRTQAIATAERRGLIPKPEKPSPTKRSRSREDRVANGLLTFHRGTVLPGRIESIVV
jgi:DNA-binding NarL/FixJ family response regulator